MRGTRVRGPESQKLSKQASERASQSDQPANRARERRERTSMMNHPPRVSESKGARERGRKAIRGREIRKKRLQRWNALERVAN